MLWIFWGRTRAWHRFCLVSQVLQLYFSLCSQLYYLCLAFYIAAKLILAPTGGSYLKASADRDRSEVKRQHNKKDNKKKAWACRSGVYKTNKGSFSDSEMFLTQPALNHEAHTPFVPSGICTGIWQRCTVWGSVLQRGGGIQGCNKVVDSRHSFPQNRLWYTNFNPSTTVSWLRSQSAALPCAYRQDCLIAPTSIVRHNDKSSVFN